MDYSGFPEPYHTEPEMYGVDEQDEEYDEVGVIPFPRASTEEYGSLEFPQADLSPTQFAAYPPRSAYIVPRYTNDSFQCPFPQTAPPVFPSRQSTSWPVEEIVVEEDYTAYVPGSTTVPPTPSKSSSIDRGFGSEAQRDFAKLGKKFMGGAQAVLATVKLAKPPRPQRAGGRVPPPPTPLGAGYTRPKAHHQGQQQMPQNPAYPFGGPAQTQWSVPAPGYVPPNAQYGNGQPWGYSSP